MSIWSYFKLVRANLTCYVSKKKKYNFCKICIDEKKKNLVFKTIKTLLHETVEEAFGKDFLNNCSTIVEKWAYFNRRH